MITTVSSEPSRLGMLGQLTSLQLAVSELTDLSIFEGCNRLQALHLGSASRPLHAAWVWEFQLKRRLRLALLVHTL